MFEFLADLTPSSLSDYATIVGVIVAVLVSVVWPIHRYFWNKLRIFELTMSNHTKHLETLDEQVKAMSTRNMDIINTVQRLTNSVAGIDGKLDVILSYLPKPKE